MNFDTVLDYDLIKIKEKIDEVKYYVKKYYVTSFLDLAKQYHINNYVRKCGLFLKYFNEGERKIAIIYNDDSLDINQYNPIEYLKIQSYNELRHNEIMGAVLNIGLKREVIGDIYCKDGKYLIAVNKAFSNYIIENLVYVSANKIKVFLSDEEIPSIERKKESIIVTSLRLDNIVSSVFNVSRELAKQAIENKYVFYNFTNELKIDQRVKMESYLSLKGKGKVLLKEIIGQTRKDKYIVELERF